MRSTRSRALPIDVLMFGVGDGRTVLYDTKVGELWGHHLDRWIHAIWRRTHQNARALIDAGHNPLEVAINRAHEKGKLIYPVLLVQMPSGERYGEETLNTRGSLFRFENKQWDIGAAGDLDPEWPGYECADFKHQEIRDERFARSSMRFFPTPSTVSSSVSSTTRTISTRTRSTRAARS